MGGGVTWEFSSQYGASLAAIVPICGGSWPDNTRAQHIASFNLPVWAFHNDNDPTVPVSYSIDYVAKINSYHPSVPARITTWPTGGHDAWTKAYDPAYKEDGKNMYEWMLQYTHTNGNK
jgi:predicted peptidase